MPSPTFRARWVVPVSLPPIENGLLELNSAGTIIDVRKARPHEPAQDLGDSILLPGFVNAHTHLELTHLKDRVPFRGSFIDWIYALMPQHPRRATREELVTGMQAGFSQSIAAGVTVIADIGGGAEAIRAWAGAAPRILGFLEAIGMGPRREGALRQAVAPLGDVSPELTKRIDLGVTPHAPYSTDTQVYREAIEFCRREGRRLCTHLAETREEEQFLREGTGPFRDMLERFGLWDGTFEVPGCSPVAYAARIGLLDAEPLLAHVNYVSDADLERLADSRASVAYCPRTHAFFRHGPHRYREMLARGINVCLGTDSLASNSTLSILDELRFLRTLDPESSDEDLLRLATVNGARAIGRSEVCGRLESPCGGDFVVVPLEKPGVADPLEDLFRGASFPSRVFVQGREVWSAAR